MKHLKLTSVLLSISMCASMVMTPVSVIAADSAAPEETQNAEVTEQEETKKETPKETENSTQKETEKNATAETEKKETEPASKEKQETEPSVEETSETEDIKPEETGPSEPEETQRPEVKEDKVSDAGKAVSKTPKAAATIPEMNYMITNDGKLIWEPVDGAPEISISLWWESEGRRLAGTSVFTGNKSSPFDLIAYIDGMIMNWDSRVSDKAQADTHYFSISAYTDKSFRTKLAYSEFVFKYKSPKKPLTVGAISNVRISPDGIVEWDPYAGADYYSVWMDGYYRKYEGTKCDLNEEVEYIIKNWSSFKVKDSYEIKVCAHMKLYLSNVIIAQWSGRYPQATNPMTVSPKTAKVKYKKLRKKKQTVARSKVMTVNNPQGKVIYKLVSVKRGKSKKYKKYFKVNSATGKVTIKKRLRKGTYKITCKVTATGDISYKGATKTVTFKIKVK